MGNCMDDKKIKNEVEIILKKYKKGLKLVGFNKVFDAIDSDFDKVIIDNGIYCTDIALKRKELKKRAYSSNLINPFIANIALPIVNFATSGYNYAKLQGEYLMGLVKSDHI